MIDHDADNGARGSVMVGGMSMLCRRTSVARLLVSPLLMFRFVEPALDSAD
jgi:hypothetical protein